MSFCVRVRVSVKDLPVLVCVDVSQVTVEEEVPVAECFIG